LTYKIIGCVFKVYNELGYGYQEKYYQRALAKEFNQQNIKFTKERKVKIDYHGRTIGRYFIDFAIDNKIALELKVASEIYQKNFNQLLAYLKSNNLKVGILAVFTKDGIKIKRAVN
jgi:GxxExxY protein